MNPYLMDKLEEKIIIVLVKLGQFNLSIIIKFKKTKIISDPSYINVV